MPTGVIGQACNLRRRSVQSVPARDMRRDHPGSGEDAVGAVIFEVRDFVGRR